MYFSSPARTRLALGPGRAVLIFGPASVLVVMESSGKQSSFVSCQLLGGPAQKRRIHPLSHRIWEDWRTSRYRTSWGAPGRATLPGDGAGRPESRASTRASANWGSDGASGNIPS